MRWNCLHVLDIQSMRESNELLFSAIANALCMSVQRAFIHSKRNIAVFLILQTDQETSAEELVEILLKPHAEHLSFIHT